MSKFTRLRRVMKKTTDWEQVGTIGVDAGLCWVGDPCYVVAKDCSFAWPTWSKFCNELWDKQKETKRGPVEFKAGVCVPSGHGDGEYPVYVKYRDGVVAEVKVVFDDGINEDGEEW